MTFRISSSAATSTTGLGYTPAGPCERVAAVVGRLDFQTALYPIRITLCFATVTLPQQVPALTRPVARREYLLVEPEGRDDLRDYTGERAFRLVSINSTAGRVVVPETGEALWTGLAPTVASTG